jgi:hypothetical protein
MKGGRKVAGVAGAAVLLLVGPVASASAAIDPLDWVNTLILRKINRVVSTLILYEQKLLDRANIDVYNRYRFYFHPDGVLNPINTSLALVRSMRSEVNSIACGWQFSPRTAMLRQLHLQPLRLCRPTFQLVWGTSVAGPDRDLNEFADYVGVLSSNQLSTRADSEDISFRRAFGDTFKLAKAGWFSVGEANRHEAVMLAMNGEVAIANNQLAAQKLLVDQLDREMDRRDDRHRAQFGAYALRGLASWNQRSPRR